jgi:hypothetical protein
MARNTLALHVRIPPNLQRRLEQAIAIRSAHEGTAVPAADIVRDLLDAYLPPLSVDPKPAQTGDVTTDPPSPYPWHKST